MTSLSRDRDESRHASRETTPKPLARSSCIASAKPTSSSPNALHRANQTYEWRVPSPPHIVVPATPLNELSLNIPFGINVHDKEISNLDFLKTVTNGNYVAENRTCEWEYSWRRKAQMILPFIDLGPSSAVRDIEYLKSNNITLLLAVRSTTSAQARLLDGSKVAREIGIESSTIDVMDNQELIAAFPRAIKAINDHLSRRYNMQVPGQPQPPAGRVLVFCESGNERSASVVAAYMMAMYELTFIQAIQFIQAQRFCVAFDEGLKVLLQSFGAIQQARRDVAKVDHMIEQANNMDAEVSPKLEVVELRPSGKRSLDEAYESEIEMGDADDQMDNDRFETRTGLAPFVDRSLF